MVLMDGLRKIVTCRRSVIALVGMGCCVAITAMTGVETAGAISLIVTSVAGANAAQAVLGIRNSPAVGTDVVEKRNATTPD